MNYLVHFLAHNLCYEYITRLVQCKTHLICRKECSDLCLEEVTIWFAYAATLVMGVAANLSEHVATLEKSSVITACFTGSSYDVKPFPADFTLLR